MSLRVSGLALAAALALSGCAIPVTQRVEVPVPVPCDAPEVARPASPVDALPDDADAFETTRALWATVETLEGYAGQLEVAVAACRSK